MLDRKSLLTTLLVFAFTALLATLYLNNRSDWLSQNEALNQTNDSLMVVNQELARQIEAQQLKDSLIVGKVYQMYFDPYDAERFRMYGLFRDAERVYSTREVAEMFNIETPTAVKHSVVLDEDWYVVPVKGVHLVSQGDTPASIAKRYYFSPNDAALIKKFNGTLKPGKFIFIPFN